MKLCIQLFLSFFAIQLASCSGSQFIPNKEAREDAKKMNSALSLQAKIPYQIQVDNETAPVSSEAGEDAADDPAIYYHESNPEKSIIIGTNKVAGLYTYNLSGEELNFSNCGKVNNVDVRADFPFEGNEIILVAASNRTTQGISFFELNPSTGQLSEKLGEIKTNVDDVYGFTLYQNKEDFFAISNGKNGVIEQFAIKEIEGRIIGKKVNEFNVESQPEGMVTLDHEQVLFVGVEEKYIKVFDLDGSKSAIIDSSRQENNAHISYDIEGLAQFKHVGRTYLIASSQGSFSYALFDITNLEEIEYITSFSLIENESVDGAEETDGIEVLAKPLGETYPAGILVVQDGFNYDRDSLVNQNFKIVDLRKVISLIQQH